MAKTLLAKESIDNVQGTAIIGNNNVVKNPWFQGNTTFWTASNVTPTLTGSGVQLVGSGLFYQTLNTADVVSATTYMAMFYANTVSGTWKLLMASSALEASDLGGATISAGWNSVRFTAGGTNYFQLVSTSAAATDTLVGAPAMVMEQEDMIVTGQIRDLDIEYGDVYFSSGSVSAPAIAFESDKDTGIYLASVADVRIGASSIAQLAVRGSAVHVLSALVVEGSATFSSNVVMGDTASVAGYFVAGNSMLVTSGFIVGGSSNFNSHVTFNNSAIFASVVNMSGAANVAGNFTVTGSINATGATISSNLFVSAPTCSVPVQITTKNLAFNDGYGNVMINTNNAVASNVGGCLALGGMYATTNSTGFAFIMGKKATATSGDLEGVFEVAVNGAGGTPAKVIRAGLDSTSICRGYFNVGGAGTTSAIAEAGAIIYSAGAFYGFTGSTFVTF